MKQRIKTFLAGGFLAVALFGAAMAGPLEDAKAAAERADFATELQILRPLADQGNAEPQAKLGLMYLLGQGVPKDVAQAVAWFRKSADQGNADGQVFLGIRYAFGDVPRDDAQADAQAVAWYRKSADQGNAEAQWLLGTMYQQGSGVPQDYAQAVVWYRKAADQGYAMAQSFLGDMYRDAATARHRIISWRTCGITWQPPAVWGLAAR
jgi:TPR repeat protein